MKLFGPINNRAAALVIHFEQGRGGKITQNVIQLGVQLGWAVEKGAVEGELRLFTPHGQNFRKGRRQQRGGCNADPLGALLQDLPVGGFYKKMPMDKFGFRFCAVLLAVQVDGGPA